jgi:NAD+ kinase
MGKRAVLFVNLQKKNAGALAARIRGGLEERGYETVVFSFEGKPQNPPQGKWDIAFSIGGDGTVLYTARCVSPMGVPILPVNIGVLGFIAEVGEDNWLDVFRRWEKGEISLSRRCMLEISVERGSRIIMKTICLNDAVISATGIAKLIKLDVQLDMDPNFITQKPREAETAGGIALGSHRCDGLIIATPTGSTAYSMAAGGPILDPEIEAVILTPICPFTLSNRPFVLPSRRTLTITVAEEQRSGVLLTVDGQDTFNLECADRVVIKQAEQPALLVYAGRDAYYSALRTKLFWSGDSPGDAYGDNIGSADA